MANEEKEKQLLLTDLCVRLPYGVLVKCSDTEGIPRYDGYRLHEISSDGSYLALSAVDIPHGVCNLDLEFCDIKPYLRPMSSMTPQEWIELCDCKIEDDKAATIVNGRRFVSHVNEESFLNSHHFDHHNLIEKGLALEAPDGMYKTK